MAYSITENMVAWLASLGHAASTDVPETRPTSFVTVEPTGASVESMVATTSLALQFWGADDASCEASALACRDALIEGAKPTGVYDVALNAGPYPFPDPYSRASRWQLALDVTHQF